MRTSTFLTGLASVVGFRSIVGASPTLQTLAKEHAGRSSVPSVDLGFEIHLGTINVRSGIEARRCTKSLPDFLLTAHQEPGQLYNFSNIRFASPPVGALRFQPPVPVTKTTDKPVNDGQQTNICPQANPAWLRIAEEGLGGVPLATLEAQFAAIQNITADQLPASAANENEDCLFLDVLVPEAVFNKKLKSGT
jgi:hypothetical protein